MLPFVSCVHCMLYLAVSCLSHEKDLTVPRAMYKPSLSWQAEALLWLCPLFRYQEKGNDQGTQYSVLCICTIAMLYVMPSYAALQMLRKSQMRTLYTDKEYCSRKHKGLCTVKTNVVWFWDLAILSYWFMIDSMSLPWLGKGRWHYHTIID